jgi:Winged helix DNA-binding domain
VRKIDVQERRARLSTRHRLAPGARASDPTEAARSLVCLHATDPATVYLSAWARTDEMKVADLDRALYDERSLVKHMSMRRTLFVFPRETMAVAQSGASDRVAETERRRLIKQVEKAGLYPDGERWLEQARAEVLEALAGGREASSSELRDEIPSLQGALEFGKGKSWGGMVSVGPQVLTGLSAAGQIVRASNSGSWTSSRPRWASMESWLGKPLDPPPAPEGVAGLVERWLLTFGPGSAADIKWWLGQTVGAVKRALHDLEAVEVELEGASTGYLLPDDLEPTPAPEPFAALLPPLDPTTMGWFERDWYLGPYKKQLFDSTGNGGPTVWWDGRIVGGWRQDDAGAVELQMLEDPGSEARDAIEAEAARLTDWFAGTRVLPRFPSPLSKQRVS